MALRQVYAYNRANESAWTNILRDLPTLPALIEANKPTFEQFARMHATLAIGWQAQGSNRQLLVAALAHALEFQTWKSLTRQQRLEDEQVIELFVRLVLCLQSN